MARKAHQLAQQGFKPDLILGHPGWGELLAIKDVFPDVPILHQLEFVYQLAGADAGFDPEFASGSVDPFSQWRSASRLRLRRAPQLLAFHDLDHALAPTHWQASTAPQLFADRIYVFTRESTRSGFARNRMHRFNFAVQGSASAPEMKL